MNLSNALLILFGLAMIANVIALVRHIRMMRVMQAVLNDLIDSQAQFNAILEHERKKL